MLIYPKLGVYEYKVNIFSDSTKLALREYIINVHKKHLLEDPLYKTEHYTFYLEQQSSEFDSLYKFFIDRCEDIFGKLTLLDINNSKCSFNVSNLDSYQARHNHINTCDINSIYYLSIPENNKGSVVFYDGDEEIIHQPVEDTLVLFPCYLDHRVLPPKTDQYRIAINMETFCKENVWNVTYDNYNFDGKIN